MTLHLASQTIGIPDNTVKRAENSCGQTEHCVLPEQASGWSHQADMSSEVHVPRFAASMLEKHDWQVCAEGLVLLLRALTTELFTFQWIVPLSLPWDRQGHPDRVSFRNRGEHT